MKIIGLFKYPIKSCRGFKVGEMNVTEIGPQGDREFMVVNEQGMFLTQRTHPALSIVETSQRNGTLEVTSPKAGRLIINLHVRTREFKEVSIWGEKYGAYDQGPDAAEFFSQHLGSKVRLVRYNPWERRTRFSNAWNMRIPVSFADGYPLLVLTQASLDALNKKLESPVSVDRFRPNILIDDTEPHAEDMWAGFKANNLTFLYSKMCERCSIPNVDQKRGVRTVEPGRTLATYRKGLHPEKPNSVFFGSNYVSTKEGVIRKWDEVSPLL